MRYIPTIPTENSTLRGDTIALRKAADAYHIYIGDASQRAMEVYTAPIKDYTLRNGTVIKLNRGIFERTVDFAADLNTFTERYPGVFTTIIKNLRGALGCTASFTRTNADMYLQVPLNKDFLYELKRDHDLVLAGFHQVALQLVEFFNETGKVIAAAAAIEASSTPAAESSSIPALIEASNIAAAAAAAAAAESSSVSVPEGSWSTFSGWVSADPIAAGFVVFGVVTITVVTVKFIYDWCTAPVTDLPLATKAAVDDISSSATDNLPIKAGFEGSFSEGVFGPFGLPLLILLVGVFYGSIVSLNLFKLYALDAMPLTKVFRVICQFFKFPFKKN